MVPLPFSIGGDHPGFMSRSRRWRLPWLASMTLIALLAVTFGIQAQAPPPPSPDRHVEDPAGFLRPETFSRLDQRLAELERSTGTQIVVSIATLLPPGEDLEEYVRRVFNAWKIGDARRNNGILFAVFVNDHRMRIEVGSGLLPQVSNALAARILRDTVAPRFRSQDYDGGVTAGVNALLHALHAQPVRVPGTATHRDQGLSAPVEGFMILAGLAGAVAGLIVRVARTRNGSTGTQVLHAILGGVIGGVGHALVVYAGMEYHWALGLAALLLVWLFLCTSMTSNRGSDPGWGYSGSGWGTSDGPWWGGWGSGWGSGGGTFIQIGGGSDSSLGSSDFGSSSGGGDSGFSGGGGSSDGGGASGSW